MLNSVFITGSSGFIGRHLLERGERKKFKAIYCLSRRTNNTIQLPASDNVHLVQGDIYDADVYAPYLCASDVVIHLAAVTGKAQPQEYFATNVEGTRFLLEQCQRWGVQYFLQVSSIAVKFPNISRYYYAQSKQQAEAVVRNSGLHYTIVRPTIVLGKDAAAWKNLSQLACGPVIPLFGDGQAKIQPIHVDDLVDVLWALIHEEIFPDEAFDIGGPEVLTIEEFLQQIAQVCHGRRARVIHIPFRLLALLLSCAEKLCYSLMPFNVGQFSVFLNNSTIENNHIFKQYKEKMKGINKILSCLARNA